MISELNCRILTKACGLCWHDYKIGDGFVSTCSCGRRGCIVREFCGSANLTFSTPDDWELVRVKVVTEYKNIIHPFFIGHGYYGDQPPIGGEVPVYKILSWWNSLSPEECCQLVIDFIKSRPDLALAKAIIEQEKGEGDGSGGR